MSLMVPPPYHSRLPALQPITNRDRARRGLWRLVWFLLFRPSPIVIHGWRRLLLRFFGARIGKGSHIYPSAKIFAPWNLRMGKLSCLADGVDCYNVAPITLGDFALVSQRVFLCTASHNYEVPSMPLTGAPIVLDDYVWVTSEVFVAPGVRFGEGAVALARAVVTNDVPAWTVVAGNPARRIRARQPLTSPKD